MGESHAKTFVRQGARVVLTDLRADAGRALQQELGNGTIFVEHDATDPAQWSTVVEQAESALGPIDVLVNNAGILGAMAKTADLTEEQYLAVCAVNQHSVFYGMRAVLQAGQPRSEARPTRAPYRRRTK